MEKRINIFILTSLVFFIVPSVIFAQTVSIESKKTTYNVGDSFLVEVKLDSQGSPINSLGGTIAIPEDLFEAFDMQTGNSFISLWVQRPELKDGQILFSGGLPGGYSGSDGTIFKFALRAKKEGSGEIKFKDFSAFLNDGNGTALTSIKFAPLVLVIRENAFLPNEKYVLQEDVTPPENFEITINKDQTIENNKYFISFFAVDKGLGIGKYEVEEDPWVISLFGYKKVWDNIESPQILYYQKWISTVKVRAFDVAGNIREEKIIKPFNFEFKTYIYLLLTMFLVIFVIKRIKK